MIDRSAIDAIAQLARASESHFTVPEDPRGLYLLEPDHTHRRVDLPLQPSSHTVYNLESLARLLSRSVVGWDTRVLVSQSAIVAVQTSSTHRVTHTLRLPVHPAFDLIRKHLNPQKYAQRELVALLRTKLAGFVDPLVVDQWRSLRFSAQENGESTVRNGAETVSKSLQQRVNLENGNQPPESIALHVPIFDVPGERAPQYAITLLVETQPGPTLELTAIHNEVGEALDRGLQDVFDRVLTELQTHEALEDVPVYMASLA